MVDKTEGATQNCSKCKTPLICNKITSTWNNKTEEKLQWQNQSDGKPHFNFAGAGKFDCNVPQDDESQEVHTQELTVTTNTSSETSGTVETKIPQMDEITEKYVDKQLILIQQIEKRSYEFLGKDARGDKVGMYVKLILEGINRK